MLPGAVAVVCVIEVAGVPVVTEGAVLIPVPEAAAFTEDAAPPPLTTILPAYD